MFFDLLTSLPRRATGIVGPLMRRSMFTGNNLELLRSSDLFDEDFYLRTYRDVAEARVDPAKHYLRHGVKEGRQPSAMFDAVAYLDDYPDVKQSGVNPLIHYLRYGQAEGRHARPHVKLSSEMATMPASMGARAGGTLDKTGGISSSSTVELGFAEQRRIIEKSGLFDPEFYCHTYPDVVNANLDPLDHYTEWGGKEGRRPHALFDPRWYTTQYPDVLESGIHPLIHYWTIGRLEGRSCVLDPRVLTVVSTMIREAGSFEPTVFLDPALAEPSLLVINSGAQHWPALRAWRSLFDSLNHPFDHIVFVPWLVRGGADLAAANAVKAAIETHGPDSTLVVLTDSDRTEAFDWLPKGTHTRVLSTFGKSLTRADRMLIVESLILSIRPKSVLNVNSAACWDAIVQKGAALRRATDLYACLFCRDYTADGRAAGYADTHFRDGLPFLRKVYFDNFRFQQELASDYGVPASLRANLATLHQPVSGASGATHKGGPRDRNSVIWAGRFCAQKNVDLLLKIVEQAPDLSFDVFGYGDDAYMKRLNDEAKKRSNLTLKGPFSSTSQLPLDNYSSFLYTSLWDGLPLTLAEAACIGIPIVASAVGGIPDLVKPSTGWLVDRFRDPEPYVQALRQIRDDPSLATTKSRQMVEWVKSEHSWEQFVSVLRASPSFIG